MKLVLHYAVAPEGETVHPLDVGLLVVEFEPTTFIGAPGWKLVGMSLERALTQVRERILTMAEETPVAGAPPTNGHREEGST